MKIKIYVEGGGDSSALKTRCRAGFRRFFEKAGLTGQMPKVVACGSRENAYDSFRTAVSNNRIQQELPLLLVDSEGPVTSPPWDHLHMQDGWKQPDAASDGQAHLMVQCMEAWFLADVECLKQFFGQTFNEGALPKNRKIERVTKEKVLKSLKEATRQCPGKGGHSFEILGRLNPTKIRRIAPHAERLLNVLEQA